LPSVASYRSYTRTVTAELMNGETVTLQVCPARYAGDLARREARIGQLYGLMLGKKDEENVELVAEMDRLSVKHSEIIATLAAEWDLFGEDGQMVPLTVEDVEATLLPEDIRAVSLAIQEKLRPNAPGSSEPNSPPSTAA